MKKFFLAMSFLVCLLFPGKGHSDIAFVASPNGNWDLFIADNNGNSSIQLTNTAYDEKDPFWSPDKKSIVYATSDGQLNLIDVAKSETPDRRNKTENTQSVTKLFP